MAVTEATSALTGHRPPALAFWLASFLPLWYQACLGQLFWRAEGGGGGELLFLKKREDDQMDHLKSELETGQLDEAVPMKTDFILMKY